MSQYRMGSRRGFTLIEILVALILIALLLGAVVPAVMNQVSKGDTGRVVEDLNSVSKGIQTFRMDVRRWPGELDQLINTISTTDTDITNTAFNQGMVNRWDGAYLDGVTLTPSTTLITGAEGIIQNAFSDDFDLNGEDYISVVVSNLPASQRRAVGTAVDGDTVYTTGRVRISGTDLYYLASPIR